jgi:hypothetical protein
MTFLPYLLLNVSAKQFLYDGLRQRLLPVSEFDADLLALGTNVGPDLGDLSVYFFLYSSYQRFCLFGPGFTDFRTLLERVGPACLQAFIECTSLLLRFLLKPSAFSFVAFDDGPSSLEKGQYRLEEHFVEYEHENNEEDKLNDETGVDIDHAPNPTEPYDRR